MREQFVQSWNKYMAVFLKEHECKTIDEMAEVAERYTDARGLGSFQNSAKPRVSESFGKDSPKHKTVAGNCNK